MLWDVFCQVVDNFGDIGVCWRLASDLGARGDQVRLWVDDARALAWMAPQVSWQAGADGGARVGTGQAGVSVHDWAQATHAATVPEPGEVVIEAFGCNPPEAFVARMQRPAPPQWVNLEYLSAESYVERSHGLGSPVGSGAGAGLSKRFYYPGFTARTGGLLREPDLMARQAAFMSDPALKLAWLAERGVAVRPTERLISMFCYGHAPLGALLDTLADQGQPTHLLLTPGHATDLARHWLTAKGLRSEPTPSGRVRWAGPSDGGVLSLTELPALPQAEFDTLLWCCDLNVVRGEDSAVRALWAGRPHIWQIYEQDDGVHAEKLSAFMDRWMADWPEPLRADVQAWWRAWNRLAPVPDALPDTQTVGQVGTASWAGASLAARARLLEQTDLATQLRQFVASSG